MDAQSRGVNSWCGKSWVMLHSGSTQRSMEHDKGLYQITSNSALGIAKGNIRFVGAPSTIYVISILPFHNWNMFYELI